MIPTHKNDPLNDVPQCKNCGAPHWPGDTHCSECGQKVFKGLPSVWQLISDFVENFFNIDNRLFRTLRDLAVPGKLTQRFLAGQQKKYYNPLRLFFISTVLMLAATAALVGYLSEDEFVEANAAHRNRAYRNILAQEISEHIDSIQAVYPDESVKLATDSLRRIIRKVESDSTGLGYLSLPGFLDIEAEGFNVAERDLYTLSPKELVEKYEVEGWINQFQVKQQARLQLLDSRGVSVLFSQAIWGVLLVVPLSALMLKLFYIRRKRKYVEHFIASVHLHTFFFLLLFICAMVYYWFDWDIYLPFFFPLAGLYLVLGIKRVYGQAWWKTLLKLFLMFFGYVFIIVICFIVSLFGAIILY